jgi:serine/threonine-protein kinase
MARFAHPNIVQVMDFGKIEHSFFLAMEFVDGLSLGTIARLAHKYEEPFRTDVIGFIGREVLAGLAHAHESVLDESGRPVRIVHRDLCPQNVLLSGNGEVKIADFGIARVLEATQTPQTSTIEGHFGYLAPEQARGEPFDERTDLFSVGIILWELLAGRRLFLEANDSATILAVLEKKIPSVSRVRSGLAPAWDSFFERALARDPSMRFATARQMAGALMAVPGADDRGSSGRLAGMVERFRPLQEVTKPTQAPTVRGQPKGPDALTRRSSGTP